MTREEEVGIISERMGAASLMCGKPHNDTLKGLLKHYQRGFVAGVKWADNHPKSPWISVDDDLPCNHEEFIKTGGHYLKETIYVITVNKYGIIENNYMILYDDGKWEWKYGAMPCYWMLIPPKLPKEIEIELTK